MTIIDHFAAPRSLISSMDQSRIFFPARDHTVHGHKPGNIDVVARPINAVKHIAPPEFVGLMGLARLRVDLLKPLIAQIPDIAEDVARVKDDIDGIVEDFAAVRTQCFSSTFNTDWNADSSAPSCHSTGVSDYVSLTIQKSAVEWHRRTNLS